MRISDWSSDVCSSDLVADAGKPDQHWQVDPRDHLYIGLAHQRNGEVGRRSAEHVGEQDHTLAAVDPCGGGRYVGPARLHVVIRADTDRLHPFLRANNMFHGGDELHRQTSMRHQNQADHRLSAPEESRGCWPSTMSSRSEEHTSELQSLMRI